MSYRKVDAVGNLAKDGEKAVKLGVIFKFKKGSVADDFLKNNNIVMEGILQDMLNLLHKSIESDVKIDSGVFSDSFVSKVLKDKKGDFTGFINAIGDGLTDGYDKDEKIHFGGIYNGKMPLYIPFLLLISSFRQKEVDIPITNIDEFTKSLKELRDNIATYLGNGALLCSEHFDTKKIEEFVKEEGAADTLCMQNRGNKYLNFFDSFIKEIESDKDKAGKDLFLAEGFLTFNGHAKIREIIDLKEMEFIIASPKGSVLGIEAEGIEAEGNERFFNDITSLVDKGNIIGSSLIYDAEKKEYKDYTHIFSTIQEKITYEALVTYCRYMEDAKSVSEEKFNKAKDLIIKSKLMGDTISMDNIKLAIKGKNEDVYNNIRGIELLNVEVGVSCPQVEGTKGITILRVDSSNTPTKSAKGTQKIVVKLSSEIGVGHFLRLELPGDNGITLEYRFGAKGEIIGTAFIKTSEARQEEKNGEGHSHEYVLNDVKEEEVKKSLSKLSGGITINQNGVFRTFTANDILRSVKMGEIGSGKKNENEKPSKKPNLIEMNVVAGPNKLPNKNGKSVELHIK